MQKKLDEKYMRMCFSLAKKGMGKVAPNPMVGCVVLDSAGEIISTGYHHQYGQNHAERDALLKIEKDAAKGGTLYVNLEPCSHYGKTPPCVDLIIEYELKRVVIGMKDVNPIVDGISKLKAAGIVVEFVLEEEAQFLNRQFIKNITKKLPYVILKIATTLDGKIATANGDSKWITSEKSRKEVYRMRKQCDCILTSSETVIADNPTMEHKIKCILDRNLRTDLNSKIYTQGKFYIVTAKDTEREFCIKVPTVNNELLLIEILKELYNRKIYSVFIEAGGKLAGSFIRENLVDEIFQFIAPKILNDNSGRSCFDGDSINKINKAKLFEIYETKLLKPDILIKYIKK